MPDYFCMSRDKRFWDVLAGTRKVLLLECCAIPHYQLTMAFTPRLINGGILTYSAAKRYDSNVLHDLSYYSQKVEFNRRLLANRELLQAAAAHHLGVSRASCIVSGQNEWLEGTYNLCIPITILARRSFAHKRVIIRFPLPYRVGEAFHAGNMDEKLRSEAATYAWLQEHCPAIPIPRLHGFALSTGQSVRIRMLIFVPC